MLTCVTKVALIFVTLENCLVFSQLIVFDRFVTGKLSLIKFDHDLIDLFFCDGENDSRGDCPDR